jgi:hypothetical protein
MLIDKRRTRIEGGFGKLRSIGQESQRRRARNRAGLLISGGASRNPETAALGVGSDLIINEAWPLWFDGRKNDVSK